MKRLIINILIFIFAINSVEAHPGIGIVKDSKNNIYYTDLTHVWKITPNGNRTIAVRNVHTHELYVDEMDNLYGEHEYYKGEDSDSWGNYVWCLTKDGDFQIIIPEVEGFLENNTLVRDAQGNSYWSKEVGEFQQINIETPNGKKSLLATHKFQNIRWMHFSKATNCIYVVDHLTIIKVTLSGKVEIIADNLKENSPPFNGVADRHYIFGLTTDSNHNIYAATFGAKEVKKITPNGIITTAYKSENEWSPCGILVDANKTKWIMEFSKSNKTRIVRIDDDGQRKIFGG
ncbi:MAG: hypothetical protein BM564_02925 [Bacteroidetes bacterium MedPE-SWsnd-G2]|nr:MAG: hypothetical protein BM564_02925 [Bacteroidetes bacterium MedPE-SWsnd-G2]